MHVLVQSFLKFHDGFAYVTTRVYILFCNHKLIQDVDVKLAKNNF